MATVVAVYIILGMLYESYVHPITILSTLPSAGLGALIVLHVGGYEISIIETHRAGDACAGTFTPEAMPELASAQRCGLLSS